MPNYKNQQSLNRYSYCVNNPLKYTDPSGHRVIVTDETLEQAWEKYKEADPEAATKMETSHQFYFIKWTPTKGYDSDCVDWLPFLHTIYIGKDLKSSPVKDLAVTIAHESFHAREGTLANSIYEEVGAYQYQRLIGNKLGVDDYTADSVKDIKLNLTGSALDSELKKAQGILSKPPPSQKPDLANWQYSHLPRQARSIIDKVYSEGIMIWSWLESL